MENQDYFVCAYVSFGVFLREHQDLLNNWFGNFPGSQQEAYGLIVLCIAVNDQISLL